MREFLPSRRSVRPGTAFVDEPGRPSAWPAPPPGSSTTWPPPLARAAGRRRHGRRLRLAGPPRRPVAARAGGLARGAEAAAAGAGAVTAVDVEKTRRSRWGTLVAGICLPETRNRLVPPSGYRPIHRGLTCAVVWWAWQVLNLRPLPYESAPGALLACDDDRGSLPSCCDSDGSCPRLSTARRSPVAPMCPWSRLSLGVPGPVRSRTPLGAPVLRDQGPIGWPGPARAMQASTDRLLAKPVRASRQRAGRVNSRGHERCRVDRGCWVETLRC
jgi:hypothetical protein